MTVLKGQIIDGLGGPPLERGIVAVEGDRIVAVAPESEYQIPYGAQVISVQNGSVLPGFIDQHVHIGMVTVDHKATYSIHPYEKVAHAVFELKNLLNAGFTSIRDCGGVTNHLKNAARKGLIDAPRLFSCGRCIVQTNGHFDMIKSFPIEFNEKGNILAAIADGVTEMRKAARMQFREGADFLKCMTTAGVVSQSGNLNVQEIADEELRSLVEEADKMGTYVASHSIGNKGIKSAIRCGVQSIEHGYYADEQDLDEMAKRGLWLIPTLSCGEAFMDCILHNKYPDKIHPWFADKMKASYHIRHETIRKAREHGVQVGFGSDFGGDLDICPHGTNGLEFVNLVQHCGYTPMETIHMATKFGSKVVMEPDLGSLEVGKLADIIMVAGDPLSNIALLSDAQNVKLVMQGGTIKKDITVS